MVVYIESNFILELIFDQEQCASAERVLEFVEQGGASLRLPSFALLEPFYRVTRQVTRRSDVRWSLEQERKHLHRATNETGRRATALVMQAIAALDEVNLAEYGRLYTMLDRIMACAQVLPITHSVHSPEGTRMNLILDTLTRSLQHPCSRIWSTISTSPCSCAETGC